MTAGPVAVPLLATDPGYLFWAPLGTAEPAHTVAASVFSVAWSTVPAWIPLGATEEGHNFNFQTSTDTILAAEFLDPLRYVSTGRTGSIAFALMDIHTQNLKRALNGGTVATVAGSGATLATSYTPPAMGAEVRCMIGWESQDATERLICYQTFNTGQVSISRRKGADNANIPVEFGLEVPTSGIPFKYYTAGTARLGV